jgi:hypothetical protein
VALASEVVEPSTGAASEANARLMAAAPRLARAVLADLIEIEHLTRRLEDTPAHDVEVETLQDHLHSLAEEVVRGSPLAFTMADALLNEEATPDDATMVVRETPTGIHPTHWAARALTRSFARSLKNAPNYLELRMADPVEGPFTVTLQRAGKRTPAQRIAELEKELEGLRALGLRPTSEGGDV